MTLQDYQKVVEFAKSIEDQYDSQKYILNPVDYEQVKNIIPQDRKKDIFSNPYVEQGKCLVIDKKMFGNDILFETDICIKGGEDGIS